MKAILILLLFVSFTASAQVEDVITITSTKKLTGYRLVKTADWNKLLDSLKKQQQKEIRAMLSGGTQQIINEKPTGVVDGKNKVFTLLKVPQKGTEKVFADGLMVIDYVMTLAGKITLTKPPKEWVRVSYYTK